MPTVAAPRGIPTRSSGTNFRSRLEARWSQFFDLIGWRWTYEPFDADGWIPDFLIAGEAPFLVEVGPCALLSEFSAKAAKPLAAGAPYPTLIAGISPTILAQETAGYLTDDGHGAGTSSADWGICGTCGTVGIFHQFGEFRLRPCGHMADVGPNDWVPPMVAFLEHDIFALWARAGNRVQWRPARRR